MSLNGKADARAPLVRFLEKNYASIPPNASAHELGEMARVWARGDPLIEKMIRDAEAAEQRTHEGRTADETASTRAMVRGEIERRLAVEHDQLVPVLGEVVAELRFQLREEFEAKFEQQQARIADLEKRLEFDAQFRAAELRLAERQEHLNEARRGPKGVKGARGERGAQGRPGRDGKDGVTMTRLAGIRKWIIDAPDYSARAVLSNGERSPKLDLHPMMEHFVLRDLPSLVDGIVDDKIAQAIRKQSW